MRQALLAAIVGALALPGSAQTLSKERYEFARIQREFVSAVNRWSEATLDQYEVDRLETPAIRLTSSSGTRDRHLFAAIDEHLSKYGRIAARAAAQRSGHEEEIDTIDAQHQLVERALVVVEVCADLKELGDEAAKEYVRRLAGERFSHIGIEFLRQIGAEAKERGIGMAVNLLTEEIDHLIDALIELNTELVIPPAGSDEVGRLQARNVEVGRVRTKEVIDELFKLPLRGLIEPRKGGKFRPRRGVAWWEAALAIIEFVNDGIRAHRTTRSTQDLVDGLQDLIVNTEQPTVDTIANLLGAFPPILARLSAISRNRQTVYGRYFPGGVDPEAADPQAGGGPDRAALQTPGRVTTGVS